jgi:hypothetical protein
VIGNRALAAAMPSGAAFFVTRKIALFYNSFIITDFF